VIAVLDACVLAGLFKRNLLLSFAEAGLLRPIWSEKILAESAYAMRRIHAGSSNVLAHEEIVKQFQHMQVIHLDACIAPLHDDLDVSLPDPDDRHVVATAIAANASIIVTDNISDFPRKVMKPFDIKIYTADEFLSLTALLNIGKAKEAIEALRLRLNDPPMSHAGLIEKIRGAGLKKTARILIEYA